jgi:hypothetical protein
MRVRGGVCIVCYGIGIVKIAQLDPCGNILDDVEHTCKYCRGTGLDRGEKYSDPILLRRDAKKAMEAAVNAFEKRRKELMDLDNARTCPDCGLVIDSGDYCNDCK